MPTTHYLATHSSGTQHLRSTSGAVYAFAVVYPRIGNANFCSRRDLAQSRAARWNDGGEVVAAVQITAKEAAAIKKTQKVKVTVEFAGKAWSISRNVDQVKPVAAVGVVRETYREPFTMDAGWHASWWAKFPDGKGYHEHEGRTDVSWFYRLADAEKYAATKVIGERGITEVKVIAL